jgi:hypothetical protein
MTPMTKSTRAMLLGAALLMGACQEYDILNTNAPTVETLTGTRPARCWLAPRPASSPRPTSTSPA